MHHFTFAFFVIYLRLEILVAISGGHMKPMGLHKLPEGSIDEVDGFLDPKEFFEHYVSTSQPLLFKGAAKSIPAFELWTDEYLASKYKLLPVDIELGKKETRSAQIDRIPMLQFINAYKTEDIYMVQDVVPAMKGDLSMLKPLQCGGFENLLEAAVIWFSSGGTKSVVHYDAVDNINCLFDGEKALVMFDKKYAEEMESVGFIEEGGYSKVDVDQVDMEKFPQFANMPWKSASMQKGDCLYIPYRWYHTVESSQGRNLAVNLWFSHLLWFNEESCDNKELQEVIPLEPFNIPGLGEQASLEKMRSDIFEVFEGEPSITHERAAHVWEADAQELLAAFNAIDTNKDMVITWQEVYTVDVMSLVQDFPFVLPGFLEEMEEAEHDEL